MSRIRSLSSPSGVGPLLPKHHQHREFSHSQPMLLHSRAHIVIDKLERSADRKDELQRRRLIRCRSLWPSRPGTAARWRSLHPMILSLLLVFSVGGKPPTHSLTEGFHMDVKSATRPVTAEWFTRVRCPVGRSQRLSTAACSRCNAPSFALTRAREGTGFAQALRRHHGRVVHRSGEDRAAQDAEY